jgi:RNA polymerase sigma-70 factor (ECF subfamily)
MAKTLPLLDIDPNVIAAAQAGDAQAHAAIYSHYANRLFTLIYRLLPRRALAEDLLQEVFVEVLRGISGFANTGPFGGWLRAIAINKSLSHLRSPWHRSLLWLEDSMTQVDAEHSVPAVDAAFALQTDLEAALRRLAPLSRAVVWLHDVEGYTHSEIGHLLGHTASFSKSQLARAHTRLREALTTHEMYDEPLSCTPATRPLSTNS